MAPDSRDGRRKSIMFAGILIGIGICLAVYGLTVPSHNYNENLAKNIGVLLLILGAIALARALSKKSP